MFDAWAVFEALIKDMTLVKKQLDESLRGETRLCDENYMAVSLAVLNLAQTYSSSGHFNRMKYLRAMVHARVPGPQW